MTWSAPIDLAMSTFLVLHTAVTSAPSSLAICTANVPTPPDALNENFVARLNPSPVAKTLERRNCRDGYSGCVLKRQVGWLRCQSLFRCAYVLGKALALESC